MRLINATFGALGLALLAGTAYAALDSDLTGARATPVQMEREGFEAADGGERHGERGRDGYHAATRNAAPPITLQDAIARVEAMGFAHILEAEYEHGRYEVEALDEQGREVEITLDAQTGQTLKQGYDD